MATIKDIVKILVEKHQMKDAAATEFLQNIVEVINEGLIADRIVKIKGLGTFKLQEVKERESVNVNTGEPVLIAAHDKVTFTPDAVMRDLVNKPFAQFETVIINDNDNADVNPDVNANVDTAKPEPTPEQELTTTTTKPEQGPTTTTMPEQEQTPEQEDDTDEEVEKSSFSWGKHIVFTVILAAAFFALGYAAAKYCWFEQTAPDLPNEPQKQKVVVKPDTAKVDTVGAKASQNPQPTGFDKVNMDPRLKYGAYSIVGVHEEVTVRKGLTLKKLAKSYLGAEDMVCYLQALNGVDEVKEGDKVKIPELKVKKHMK